MKPVRLGNQPSSKQIEYKMWANHAWNLRDNICCMIWQQEHSALYFRSFGCHLWLHTFSNLSRDPAYLKPFWNYDEINRRMKPNTQSQNFISIYSWGKCFQGVENRLKFRLVFQATAWNFTWNFTWNFRRNFKRYLKFQLTFHLEFHAHFI